MQWLRVLAEVQSNHSSNRAAPTRRRNFGEFLRSMRGSRVHRRVSFARLTGAQAWSIRGSRVRAYRAAVSDRFGRIGDRFVRIGDRIRGLRIRHVSRYASWRIGYVSVPYRVRIRIGCVSDTGTGLV